MQYKTNTNTRKGAVRREKDRLWGSVTCSDCKTISNITVLQCNRNNPIRSIARAKSDNREIRQHLGRHVFLRICMRNLFCVGTFL